MLFFMTIHGILESREANRRKFLGRLSLVLSSIIGAAASLPVIGFIVAPAFRRTQQKWRSVGPVAQYEIGSTVEVSFEDPSPEVWSGVTAKTGAWLRRVSEEEFIAFAINCRHLGCPVRWEESPQLFMCPCHGGVYYANGDVAGGPPPEPLARYSVRVRKGVVEIETGPVPLTTNRPL